MLTLFKTTSASLRDKQYYAQITPQTVKASFKYWAKYVLLISLLPFIFSLFALTYTIPQLPRLAKDILPSDTFEIKNGQLSSTQTQPLTADLDGFKVYVSPQFTEADLTDINQGVLVTQDKFYLKSPDGDYQSFSLSSFNGLVVSQDSVSNWLSTHTPQLYLIGILALFLLTLLTTLVMLLIRLLLLLIWSALVVGLGKIFGYSITFSSALKVAFYAAVPALLISTLVGLLPAGLASFSSLVDLLVFITYALIWTKPLLKSPPVQPIKSHKK